jgi:uncharacterized damage-inducible protein DinB
MIDQAFDRRSWHGPNLRGSLRGVSAAQAAWRPAPSRHNIWEQALHAAYWKYIVWRGLTGEKRGSFALAGSNWFVRPAGEDSSEKAWKADLALLTRTHRALRQAVAERTPTDLHGKPPGSQVSTLALITGIAAHDFYHAGQIQLLKRLQSGAPGG